MKARRYQEIMTDPSYAGQFVCFTCPHIGNVGINDDDMESKQCHLGGIIIRSLTLLVSNYRSDMSIEEYCKQQNIMGIGMRPVSQTFLHSCVSILLFHVNACSRCLKPTCSHPSCTLFMESKGAVREIQIVKLVWIYEICSVSVGVCKYYILPSAHLRGI